MPREYEGMLPNTEMLLHDVDALSKRNKELEQQLAQAREESILLRLALEREPPRKHVQTESEAWALMEMATDQVNELQAEHAAMRALLEEVLVDMPPSSHPDVKMLENKIRAFLAEHPRQP